MSLARLIHDVGKYASRTARNLPDGAIDQTIVAMLCRDLYERHLPSLLVGVEPAQSIACDIAALEPAVRAGDDAAIRRAARLALELDASLRKS